jgi:hypothetical protein
MIPLPPPPPNPWYLERGMEVLVIDHEGKIKGKVEIPQDLLDECYNEIETIVKEHINNKHDNNLLSRNFKELSDKDKEIRRAISKERGRIEREKGIRLRKDIKYVTVNLLNDQTKDQAIKDLASAQLTNFLAIVDRIIPITARIRKKMVPGLASKAISTV